MPSYKTAIATAAPQQGSAYATFQTGANRRALINALTVTTQTATASFVALVAANNTPVSTSPTTPVANDAGDAAPTCALAATWTTAPTISATPNYLMRFVLGPAIGAGFTYRWPRDDQRIALAKNSGSAGWLVFWNTGTAVAAALDLTVEYDE